MELNPSIGPFEILLLSTILKELTTIYEDADDKIDTSSVELVIGVSFSPKDIIGPVRLVLEYL